ncbi:hypothetical protein IAI10_18065 [Clostridium sp. 19966]|uniref:Ig-like domain-containing protein n=1 Tax=Clostridium sp. 19966 TaxID=2768166 RepID=UPI0028DE779E|nr:Ig-like domain-containing protein [Clostridium sp. 19966]MDT8718574.1 hypothetical protein [Clostridium sp. 19966]
MNRKKISSIIMAFFLASYNLSGFKVYAANSDDNNILQSIEDANSYKLQLDDSALKNEVSWYDITGANKDVLIEIQQDIESDSYLSSIFSILYTNDKAVNLQISKTNDTEENINKLKDKINNRAVLEKNESFETGSSGDISTAAYIKDSLNNEKFLKISSLSSNKIIPSITWEKDFSDKNYSLVYAVSKKDSSGNSSKETHRFTGLSAGTLSLSEIDGTDLSSITLNYNILDSNGNIIKKCEQTLTNDTTAPKYSIKNISCDVNNQKVTVQINAPDEANLLENPIVYYNNKVLDSSNITYNNSEKSYSIVLDNVNPLTSPLSSLTFYAADDALNLGEISLTGDFILSFDKIFKNQIMLFKDNVLKGSASSAGKISDLSINSKNVDIASDNSFSTNLDEKTSTIDAKYTYAKDDNTSFPVELTAAIYSSSSGPNFSSFTCTSGGKTLNVANSDTLYITDKNISINGILSDYSASAININSIKARYDNEESEELPKDSYSLTSKDDSSDNLCINLSLKNDDDKKLTAITIDAKNDLGYESSFTFNLDVDNTAPTLSMKYEDEDGHMSDLKDNSYFSSSFSPAFIVSDSNLDLDNSYVKLISYDNSGNKVETSTALRDLTLKDDNLYVLKNLDFQNTKYDILLHAVDKSGNTNELKQTFYFDSEAPKITYSGALENASTAFTSSKNGFIPVITIEDYLLTEDEIKDSEYLDAKFNGTSLTIDHIESSLNENGEHKYKLVYKSVNSPDSKDGSYDITAKVTGLTGLSSSSSKSIYFDNTPPIISFWDQNNLLINNNSVISTKAEPIKPTIYIGDDVKISSDAISITKKTPDGNLSTIDSSTLSPSDNEVIDGKLYSSGWTFRDTINDPGEYTITVNAEDAVGNAYENGPFILHFIVDNSAPVINIDGISDNEFSNSTSLTAAITASDDNFSEGTAILTKDDGSTQTISLNNNKAENINIKDEGKYKLKVTAKDAAGNSTSVTRSFCIDRTAPEITSFNLTNSTYYRKAIDPRIAVKESNLDRSKSYFNVNKNGTLSQYTLDSANVDFDNATDEYVLKNVVNEDGSYNVTVHIVDLAGNQTSNGDLNLNFFVQSKAATVSIKNINDNEYFNQAVTPEIEVEDPYMDSSDLNSRITATLNGQPYELTSCKREGSKLIVTGKAIENPKDSLGDNYTLKVTTKDRTNSTDINSGEKSFTIDEAAPSLETSNLTNEKYYRKALDPAVELQEKYLDETNSYFIVTKNGVSSKYSLDDANVQQQYNTEINTSDYTYTLKNVVDVDGTYEITVHLVDLSGNSPSSGDTKYTIYIDSVPASTNIVNIGDPSQGKKTYFNSSVTPEISVTDEFMDAADVNKLITATINNKPYTLHFDKKENGVLYLHGDELKPDAGKSTGTYALVVSTSDRASQPGEFETISQSFVIDEAKPIIKATNMDDNRYYRSFDNPSVTIAEDYLDLKNSYFSVSKDGNASTNYSFGSSNVSNDGSGTYFLNGVVQQDGKYVITIHVQDMSGNNADSDVTKTIYIDKHPAVPIIQNIDEGKNYNSQVTALIKVEDKFLQDSDINTSRLYAALDGQTIRLNLVEKDIDPNTGETIFLLKTDPITGNTARNTMYNLKVYALDMAANYDPNNQEAPGTDSRDFVVDTDPAKISFSEDSGRNIEDNGYYNGVIKPIIKLTDNYTVDNYSITLNGKPYNGSVEKTDDGYVFKGAPINGDGLYTLSVTDNDKAQASPTTYQISFTMDNTKPNIDISGVQNNEFNNKSVTTPTIRISDTNMVLENTHINVYKNGSQIPVNISQNDNLFSFSEYDEGTYTFNVTAVDKAGNSYTTPDLTFTIDRTPPTMKFNFNDGDFINKPFAPEVSPDNPDDFISELLINGQSYDSHNVPILTENRKYEIKAIAKDKAGNVSEEIVKSFVLDTEAPNVDISGLVSNFYYNKNISPLITCTDTNSDIFNITLNGQPYNNSVISAEGSYELVVFAEDKAKNITRIVLDFVIDKTAPSITVPTFMSQSTFLSIFTPLVDIDDADCDKTLMLDGNDYHGEPITTDGKHTLLIIAVDRAGNVSKKAFTFYLKATPPSIKITNIIDGRSYDHPVTPEFNISDDAVREATVITLDGKDYKIGDKISSIGEHTLTITVKDSVGNKTTRTVKFKIVSAKESLTAKITNKKGTILPILGGAAAGIAALGTLLFVKTKKSRLRKAEKNKEIPAE